MTSSTRIAVRRVATLSVASLTAFALMAAPAMADVPVGWSQPPHISALHWLAVLVFFPLGLAFVIGGFVMLPGVLKGEGLVPKAHPAPEFEEPSSHH